MYAGILRAIIGKQVRILYELVTVSGEDAANRVTRESGEGRDAR